MLYHLSAFLKGYWSFFNIVHYVSFRAMAALLTSLLSSFIWGNQFILTAQRFFRSDTRPWTPESHKLKGQMPTMGGIFILLVFLLNSLLWINWYKIEIFIVLGGIISFGLIGFLDDWNKIRRKKGISSRTKFLLQLLCSLSTATLLWYYNTNTALYFPFFKNFHPDLGWVFIPWAALIIVGSSNAVNLTDGLDGLAIGSLIPNFATFSLICYIVGNQVLATYLQLPCAPCAEFTIIGATLLGSSIGFLWYNAYPAQIFMGDVGSLALGSALAYLAIVSKQELILLLSGGLFVLETLSVIIQVTSFKVWKKRLFRMAPIHHHFELLGWPEAKITVRFAIISLILCIIALMTLKIR